MLSCGKSHHVLRQTHTCTQTEMRHTVVQKHKDKEVTVLIFSHSSAGESKQVIPLLLNASFSTVKIKQHTLMLCCYGTKTVKESSVHVCEDSQTLRLYRMSTSVKLKKPRRDFICSSSMSPEVCSPLTQRL